MMRIDEFSAPVDIDGSLDTTEQTRFLCFGFDIPILTIGAKIKILFAKLLDKITITGELR